MKTKHEILDDVVKHIKKQGGRSVYNGKCLYIAPDGKTCGHSMALKPSFRVKANEITDDADAVVIIDKFTDKCHKKNTKDMMIIFGT